MKKILQFYDLNVYKKTLDLEKQVNLSTQKMPTDYRREVITPYRLCCRNLVKAISYAHKYKDYRLDYIKKARDVLYEMVIDTRHWYDMGFIKEKGFTHIKTIEGEIFAQLNGWERKTIQQPMIS